MARKKEYSLFLNNKYSSNDNHFYLSRIRRSTAVAVDGGLRFFLMNKIYPDILIGDFDSAPAVSKKYLSNMEVLSFPSQKDKTDSHLALELALQRGASQIEIFGAISDSEIDHTLGNIFLLELVNKFNQVNSAKVGASIIAPRLEIRLLENASVIFKGVKGNFVSVIPLSDAICAQYDGLLYPPPKAGLKFGDSLSLRNQFLGKTCKIKITGKALIVLNHTL